MCFIFINKGCQILGCYIVGIRAGRSVQPRFCELVYNSVYYMCVKHYQCLFSLADVCFTIFEWLTCLGLLCLFTTRVQVRRRVGIIILVNCM